MLINDRRSPWTRAGLSDADRAHIEAAGPGLVRFSRFDGKWNAHLYDADGQGLGWDNGPTMRAAFDRAMDALRRAA
jgi:hypothetical protein